MEFTRLLQLVGDEPVFESGFLLAGEANAEDVRRQLSRWVRAGRLYLLRRGLYALAPPFQKVRPHPFLIANRMISASYVSCQSALAYEGLIPEFAAVTLSVTTRRPTRWETPLGVFEFRHVKTAWLRGYRQVDLGGGQHALVAAAEKALLDLIYLQPGADSLEYLQELRLQNLERLNPQTLLALAQASGLPKLKRAARIILELAGAETKDYETL